MWGRRCRKFCNEEEKICDRIHQLAEEENHLFVSLKKIEEAEYVDDFISALQIGQIRCLTKRYPRKWNLLLRHGASTATYDLLGSMTHQQILLWLLDEAIMETSESSDFCDYFEMNFFHFQLSLWRPWKCFSSRFLPLRREFLRRRHSLWRRWELAWRRTEPVRWRWLFVCCSSWIRTFTRIGSQSRLVFHHVSLLQRIDASSIRLRWHFSHVPFV